MTTSATTPPDEAAIRDLLKQVIDPEAGMNIVDLGLIYRVEATPEKLLIDMTMTSPACPLSEMIIDNIKAVLAPALPQGCVTEIRLVWQPPWDPSMMSDASRQHFGW